MKNNIEIQNIIINDSKLLIDLFSKGESNKEIEKNFYLEFLDEIERLISKFKKIRKVLKSNKGSRIVNYDDMKVLKKYLTELKYQRKIIIYMSTYQRDGQGYEKTLKTILNNQLLYLKLFHGQFMPSIIFDEIKAHNSLQSIMQQYNIEFPKNSFEIHYIMEGMLNYLNSKLIENKF
ncbi:MAG: hypothetical protein ACTTGJ_03675 [Clostridium sp.]